ncbi:MAG TPA: NAD(P)H-binding protein [Solirubrobacterales bacterium]|nr:NAD(P)H-binding protein [Solirubrobacterales bacterium]
MVVAIAGAHGKIGLLLTTLLAERGDRVLSIIRNPDHADHVRTAGGEPVVVDLENSDGKELGQAIADADAVVFAAGAGPGSGAARKETMDYGGAVLLIEAARLANATRYVMISAMSADADHEGEEVFDVYIRAKGRADDELAESGLEHTIVRPGGLTDDEPKGRVAIAETVERGEIPRADVAAVVAACLANSNTIGHTFEVVSGDDQIEAALSQFAG